MNIGRINRQSSEWEQFSQGNISDASAVVFELKRKKVKVRKATIKDIAKGMAEVAYSMGETNDPEAFASLMAEEIVAGLEEAEDRRRKRPRTA